MSIKNVYDVAARAMSAQIVRMNAIASNLAASWKVHLISNRSVFLRTSGEAIDFDLKLISPTLSHKPGVVTRVPVSGSISVSLGAGWSGLNGIQDKVSKSPSNPTALGL